MDGNDSFEPGDKVWCIAWRSEPDMVGPDLVQNRTYTVKAEIGTVLELEELPHLVFSRERFAKAD